MADEVTTKNATKSSADLKALFSQYLLPILLVVISLVIVFAVTLPLLQLSLDNYGKINELSAEYQTLDAQRKVREQLIAVTNDQQSDLVKIDRLIPQSTSAVVEFRKQIGDRAQQFNINLSRAVLGEAVVVSTTKSLSADQQITNLPSQKKAELELIEVPAEFILSGSLGNMRSFLNSFYGGSEFVIIKKMELTKLVEGLSGSASKFSTSATDNWSMQLTLTKYQFRADAATNAQQIRDFYFAIPDTDRPDQTVLEYLTSTYQ